VETVDNWSGLLKRLATARALDRLRQRRREVSRYTSMPEGFHPLEKAAGPSQVAEAAELIEHLRIALAGLKPRQAEVFCLACLEGLDYHKIAEQVGLTEDHVGVLLTRAKSSLRKRLGAHFPPYSSEREPYHGKSRSS
jgi:RNA polymerase sigma-70 factor (ECF subfamily)